MAFHLSCSFIAFPNAEVGAKARDWLPISQAKLSHRGVGAPNHLHFHPSSGSSSLSASPVRPPATSYIFEMREMLVFSSKPHSSATSVVVSRPKLAPLSPKAKDEVGGVR